MERNGKTDDSLCAEEEEEEEEEVDPRIQGELEKLNQSTDTINRLESELEDFRQRFRAVLVEATVKLDELIKKIGRSVDDSKPYWEARKVARKAQIEAQKATQEFQRAVEILRAAKETIALAEEKLLEEDSRQFDSAWQEMLNHATQRVMEAEQARTQSEAEYKKTTFNYNSSISLMKQLEKKLKRSINKSRPYFELKAKYYLQLEQLKHHVDERQTKLMVAKSEYRTALRNLESISEEIHAHRRSHAIGTRERGVGAEVDEGHDDITDFKMESDGLSMVSVSVDEEGSHSSEEEEDTPPPPHAKRCPPRPPLHAPILPPLPPPLEHAVLVWLPSLLCPLLLLPRRTGVREPLQLSRPRPGVQFRSRLTSPGPSQPVQWSFLSGLRTGERRQSRRSRGLSGGRHEQADLDRLSKPRDSEDEQDPHYINPEISSPSSATSILLLNGV